MEIAPRPGALVSDLGWEISSKGFEKILKATHARTQNLPLIVTENGIADCTDRYRPTYITNHLKALHRAIQGGVPVEGYCHWSLLDNFEWLEGFGPRFGLYEMNYSTLERKERASGRVFSQIARDNGIFNSERSPLTPSRNQTEREQER